MEGMKTAIQEIDTEIKEIKNLKEIRKRKLEELEKIKGEMEVENKKIKEVLEKTPYTYNGPKQNRRNYKKVIIEIQRAIQYSFFYLLAVQQ